MLAKAATPVLHLIGRTPTHCTDLELKKAVLEKFSDMGTPSEATQKLRTMRMDKNTPIASWNHKWTTIHEIAYQEDREKKLNQMTN